MKRNGNGTILSTCKKNSIEYAAKKAKKEAEKATNIKIARNLLSTGVEIDIIAKATDEG